MRSVISTWTKWRTSQNDYCNTTRWGYRPGYGYYDGVGVSWLLAGFCFLLGFFLGTIAAEIYDLTKLK